MRAPAIPPGDGVVLAESGVRWFGRWHGPGRVAVSRPRLPDLRQASERLEETIRAHSGLVFLTLVVTALAVLVH
jgi:hypothetical protein